jgi:predicted Ser/Thr protein kinase
MTDAKTCPTCGAPLAADAPGGACPKCLLGAGFATGSGGGAPAADRVPTPEELAPRFPGLAIDRLLGRGGMGVVYKARHKALDRDVALKVLPASVAADPHFAERFQREARALARLHHPNIVLVHDFGQSDGLFWLVMEYVDGTNIRQAMKAGAIGPQQALAIVPQICDALQYAHEHGVVHRDIKPENVLLDKAGRVKVADFGLAKMMEHGELDHTLTGAGQVMGTPHYMAPEQWERPKDVDHRADIYSLGVVFYEMLTGELPVGRFAAPSKKSDVDARIDDIVLRTLEREREARYQHAQDVKTDVGRATSAGAADAPPPPARGAAGEHVEVTEDGVVVTKSGEGGKKRVVVGRHGVRVEKQGEKDVHVRWHWDAAEEKARGGKLSKLAVAGVLAAPLAIVVAVVCALGSNDWWATFTVAMTIAIAGWIASIVAWVRIQNSGDRLRGRAWAAVGTFLPLLLCCAGGPLSFLLTGTKPPEPPAPEPSRLVPPAMPADAGVRTLLARLIDVGDDRSLAKVRALYPRWNSPLVLRADDDADVATQGPSGRYGLPLISDATLEMPLRRLRVKSVEESADRLSARVVLERGDRTVEFGIVNQNGEWFFAPEPVLVR